MPDWFVASSVPAQGASLVSSTIRVEFASIQTDIADKLPTLTGNGDEVVVINSGGTALTSEGPLTVAKGGTGAASLTDGGILLGSGTGAITAMGVLADGAVAIGDGTTDPTTLAAFTSSTGQLKHEYGGVEANISAIADGGILVGTGTGTMAIRASVLTGGAAGYLKHEVGGLEADISAIADGDFIVGTGVGTLGLESGATARSSMGLGSIATQNSNSVTITGGSISGITDLAIADGGTGASTEADARTNLGVAIGSDVQAYDAELAAIAGLTSTADSVPYFTGSGTAALATITSFGRSLVDDASASAARTTLGLGTIATQSAGSVAITGGTINNVIIGGSTPAAGHFTTLDTTGVFSANGAITSVTTNGENYIGKSSTEGLRLIGKGSTYDFVLLGSSGGTEQVLRSPTGTGNVEIPNGTLSLGTDLAVTEGGTGASSASDARTNLGLGSIATQASSSVSITGGSVTGITDLAIADGGTGASSAANARSNLGAAASGANTDITSLTLGNTGLAIADTNASHNLTIKPGSDLTLARTLTITTGDADRTLDISAGSVTISTAGAALIDDASASAQRTTLGLGSLATLSTINNSNWSGTDLAIINGGTGASDAATARSNLGAAASSITLTAGTGLSGGGDISANRTFNLDLSGLSAMTVAPAGSDEFLYNDGGSLKTMSYNESAAFSNTDANDHTFASTDVGGIRYYTGAGGHSWTMNSGVGQDNCMIMVVNSGSGNLTIASGTATVSTGGLGLVIEPNGVAILVRESSTQWFMGGTGLAA